MSDNSLSRSFAESIKSNYGDAVIDTTELLVDGLLDDGILKEIPVVKYVVATYHIIDDIRGKTYLRKLGQFLNTFNAGIASESDVAKYRERVTGENRNLELEYVLTVIDRYLDIEKPCLLAKLYLAYLSRVICWDDFCTYSEVLDHVFRNDIRRLKNDSIIKVRNNQVPAELLRLTGAGLMMDYQNNLAFIEDGNGGIAITEDAFDRIRTKERIYSRTEFGQKFVEIISK